MGAFGESYARHGIGVCPARKKYRRSIPRRVPSLPLMDASSQEEVTPKSNTRAWLQQLYRIKNEACTTIAQIMVWVWLSAEPITRKVICRRTSKRYGFPSFGAMRQFIAIALLPLVLIGLLREYDTILLGVHCWPRNEFSGSRWQRYRGGMELSLVRGMVAGAFRYQPTNRCGNPVDGTGEFEMSVGCSLITCSDGLWFQEIATFLAEWAI